MVNLNEKITFTDGFKDYDGNEERVEYVVELGKRFGLALLERYLNGNTLVCKWYGTRKDMLAYFSYYIASMTYESKGTLMRVQGYIIDKQAEDQG